jgi:hypothetical protein
MMNKVKMLCFDMDGTIANLYEVDHWLDDLRAENPRPYVEAKPMWDMKALADALIALKVEVRIITWLSKDSSETYKDEVRKAKLEWLKKQGFPFDKFHGVRYGATKADSVRKYLAEDETAILFDDNAKVRSGWTLGETIDPMAVDIVKYLREMVA